MVCIIFSGWEAFMNLTLDLREDELALLEKYADKYNMSMLEFIKNAIQERIKDEHDMEVYENAIKSYTQNPLSYTHSSLMRELGLAK